MRHIPVMTAEVIEWLSIRPGGRYLDVTVGQAGHAAAIAGRLTSGELIANDQDPEALAAARLNTEAFAERITFTRGRFSDLYARLKSIGRTNFDGLVGDLGVNRQQLVSAHRGFSFMSDGPLDMRMDPAREETAADLVNRLDEKSLADLIYRLGEERRSRQIARAIVRARPIHTTGRLASVINSAVPRTEKTNPATRTFMALRLAVNQELEELAALLELMPGLLKPGGRAVILTFHSLEDRIVKYKFLEFAAQDLGRVLTKKVITPGREETARNPNSRSAKLRCFERKQEEPREEA
jgi:16S rRNA (cytosine1402-N4)-methyltransferase